jgi:hypothetical protein
MDIRNAIQNKFEKNIDNVVMLLCGGSLLMALGGARETMKALSSALKSEVPEETWARKKFSKLREMDPNSKTSRFASVAAPAIFTGLMTGVACFQFSVYRMVVNLNNGFFR